MRKLKLESVKVESFHTTSIAPRERGTVNAHGKPGPIQTYNVDLCGDTQYFDCTLGCSQNTQCAGACGVTVYRCLLLTEADCV
ncbi:MAG TPA: hypothetical protein VFT45_13775 [Longimicrobium sp.]|nr:hypothetical protein [Longimicrobium sp.]